MRQRLDRALVIGLGISGKASAALLLSKGFIVTAVDRKAEELKSNPLVEELIHKGLCILSEETELDLGGFSFAVLSPGIEPSHPLVQKAKREGVKIVGEIELAMRFLVNRCVLGVTGSNG